MSPIDPQAFYHEVLTRGLYSTRHNLDHFLSTVFGNVVLNGCTVLDIGGGMGLLSFAAIQRGAARAVLVEPEARAAGGTAGVVARFREVRDALGWSDRVTLHPGTFQAFDPGAERFDLVLSHNSINHLDERACAQLHRSAEARGTYLEIFAKVRGLMRPGGRFVILDCARHNLFGDLGIRSPIMPAIEWRKHQQPRVWAQLLSEAGLTEPAIRWTTLHSLGRPGRLLLGNSAAAYVLTSHFRLEVRCPAEVGEGTRSIRGWATSPE
jgi:SAM-dependent methyltransferase